MLVVCAEYLGKSVERERPVPEEITSILYLHSVTIRAVTVMYTAEGPYSRK